MTTTAKLNMNARDAYEALADGYDVFTGGYDHERWLQSLEQLAIAHGLQGRRLLDVACGTGASFAPLLARGYDVTGCDLSAAMLSHAGRKAPQVDLRLADMRELPSLGDFDLVICIDDALNYLLGEAELAAAFRGFTRNLAPGGLAIWDLNTLAQYRGQFARDLVVNSREDMYIGWKGTGGMHAMPGSLVEINVDVFTATTHGAWVRSSSRHTQRHWRRDVVEALSHEAGLRTLEVRGQFSGAVLAGELDENVHAKAIYIARADREEIP